MNSKALAWILLSAVGLGIAHAREYYVSPAGDDASPGTQTQPWRTIKKVNATDFAPDDCMRFQGGETFAGTVLLDQNDNRHSGIDRSGVVVHEL